MPTSTATPSSIATLQFDVLLRVSRVLTSPGCRVLDLSAGTGLVGLVAHRRWDWTGWRMFFSWGQGGFSS
jgi:hypothetical protein